MRLRSPFQASATFRRPRRQAFVVAETIGVVSSVHSDLAPIVGMRELYAGGLTRDVPDEWTGMSELDSVTERLVGLLLNDEARLPRVRRERRSRSRVSHRSETVQVAP